MKNSVPYTLSLDELEVRRPGIRAIIEELRVRFPRSAEVKIVARAKVEWQLRHNPQSIPVPTYKFQYVLYQAHKGGGWRAGLARVQTFGVSDVAFIVDCDTGQRLEGSPWDYRLQQGPLCYINTGDMS